MEEDQTALAAVLYLCTGGGGVRPSRIDWTRTHRVAVAHRCCALAWWRSGELIRQDAPPEVASAWRAHAVAAMRRAELQAKAAQWLVALLRDHGIGAAVARGVVLSERLYGHIALRSSSDVDLFLDESQHVAARDLLVRTGATAVENAPPFQTSYRLAAPFEGVSLELHSWLLDDTLLTCLRVPTGDAETQLIGGCELPTLPSHIMPAYLAADAASDCRRTLLQELDFHTLWSGLSPRGRAEAMAAAKEYGLGGYLRRAVLRSTCVDDAIAGDATRLAGLIAARPRHQLVSLLGTSDSLVVASRTFLEWLMPEQPRQRGRDLAALWAGRLAKVVRIPPQRRAAVRLLATDQRDTLELVRASTMAHTACWMRARGTSMEPAIPDGARVRLESLGGPVHVGDIVLAELDGGGLVIHRVRFADAQTVILRGDNLARDDTPTAPTRVIARVTAVERRPAWSLARGRSLVGRGVGRLRHALPAWARVT